METALCLVCGTKPVKYKCGDCEDIEYCSEACQTADWIEGHYVECIDARAYSSSGGGGTRKSFGSSTRNYSAASSNRRGSSRSGGSTRSTRTSSAARSSRNQRQQRAGDRWIQKAHLHEGAFTNEAKRHGMSTQRFMNYVLKNPEHFSSTTFHRALFMKNAKKFKN